MNPEVELLRKRLIAANLISSEAELGWSTYKAQALFDLGVRATEGNVYSIANSTSWKGLVVADTVEEAIDIAWSRGWAKKKSALRVHQR